MNRPLYYQQPYYYNPYAQQNIQPMPPIQPQPASAQTQQSQQITQNGFVVVQSEQDARAYPVAPGNSITFKDENSPYCYVKTMGFSQFDQPVFEKYRLVKEDSAVTEKNGSISHEEETPTEYATKEEFEQLRAEFGSLKGKVAKLRETRAKKRIEEVEDDDE
ncbi:MAG: hypothetical protein IKU25_09455 [Clostridia bacterium]|nr:hypothetical protein [Clostridia bacterium]